MLPLLATLLIAQPDMLVGGIQVHEESNWYWTHTLKRTGMNTVAATVYIRQADWDTAWMKDKEEPSVIEEIREAKKVGLEVVLIMRVALDHWFEKNRFLWHGMIMPKDQKTLEEWFRLYGAFVVKWAKIAESEGVDVFAIGSEMNALASTRPISELPQLEEWYLNAEKQRLFRTTLKRFAGRIKPRHIESLEGRPFEGLDTFVRRRANVWRRWAERTSFGGDLERINARAAFLDERWREIIAMVRSAYRGRVTYAANFDQYHRVGFWDALDLMGINAYFALRRDLAGADEATFEAAWTKVFTDIRKFQAASGLEGRQVLFTELGYTVRRHCTVEPWGQKGFSVVPSDGKPELVLWAEEPQDDQERVRAIRALNTVQRNLFPRMLAGVLYWKLSTIRTHLEIEPFVLIIDEEGTDPLQTALTEFLIR